MTLRAQALGAQPNVCEILAQATPLHNIGTLGVPEYVMRKTDALNPAEWQEMRRHPEFGAAIIGEHKDPLLSTARATALAHHERRDGTGQPEGLKGDANPVPARHPPGARPPPAPSPRPETSTPPHHPPHPQGMTRAAADQAPRGPVVL